MATEGHHLALEGTRSNLVGPASAETYLGTKTDCRYNKNVEYEWDVGKNEANIAKGRIGFDAMEDFEWDTAVIQQSDRGGEVRWAATGYIGNRLYRVVYTLREDRIRIISLRMASRKEERDYAEA